MKRTNWRYAPHTCALAAGALLSLAAVSPASAQIDKPIKIGVIAESQAVAGSSIPQAAQLAADEINKAGGVNGRKLELVAYDTTGDATKAVQLATKLIKDDKVVAITASVTSRVP